MAIIARSQRRSSFIAHRLSLIGWLWACAALLAACGASAAPEAPVDELALNPTAMAAATATTAAVATSEAIAKLVEFEWQSTGKPEQFDSPADIAVDSKGDVYVVDGNNNRIVKLNSQGELVKSWGRRGGEEGEFFFLYGAGGIAVDADDNVYVADSGNARIQKFDASGAFMLQWGERGRGDGQFYSVFSLDVDRSGNVYLMDPGNYRVQKFDAVGRFLMTFGKKGAGDGEFNQQAGDVAVDTAGNVYVADRGNGRVQVFDPQGAFVRKFDTCDDPKIPFGQPYGLTVDAEGSLYVVFFPGGGASHICKLDRSGKQVLIWGESGAGNGQFEGIGAVAVDGRRNVYATDYGNRRVQKFRQP
jgi:DNA-binding beta-propeller fold protein YncE